MVDCVLQERGVNTNLFGLNLVTFSRFNRTQLDSLDRDLLSISELFKEGVSHLWRHASFSCFQQLPQPFFALSLSSGKGRKG